MKYNRVCNGRILASSYYMTKGSYIPENWAPDDKCVTFARGLNLNPEAIKEAFRDYWLSASGKNAIKRDWSAAWRTWCRKTAEVDYKLHAKTAPKDAASLRIYNEYNERIVNLLKARNPMNKMSTEERSKIIGEIEKWLTDKGFRIPR